MTFSPKQLEMIEVIRQVWPNYTITDRLGTGKYGVVFLAERQDPGTDFVVREAIKVIDLRSDEDEDLADLMDIPLSEYYELKKKDQLEEIRIMDSLRAAPNVIHINDYRIVESDDLSKCYVLIRMDAMTSLERVMKAHRDDPPEAAEATAVKVGLDICKALYYLQETQGKTAAHRDIKPANILMSANGDYYLSDFGFARLLNASGGNSYKGTQEYIAPEVSTGEYDCSVDIYSLGLVLYRIVNHGNLPFIPGDQQRVSDVDRAKADIRLKSPGRIIPKPSNCSDRLAVILQRMCAYDPKHRYASAEDVEKALLELSTPKVSLPETLPDHLPSDSKTTDDAAPELPDSVRHRKDPSSGRKTGKWFAAVLLITAVAALIWAGASKLHLPSGNDTQPPSAGEPVVSGLKEIVYLSDLTITESNEASFKDSARNTIGHEYRNVLLIGGFGQKDAYARFHVGDYDRIIGSVSCPDSFADGQEGLFTIYADDNASFPLYSAEIRRTMTELSFDLDLSGVTFLTFAIHSDDPTEVINAIVTDTVLGCGEISAVQRTEVPAADRILLSDLSFTENIEATFKDSARNTIGHEYRNVLLIGSFGQKDAYARFYVGDYGRIIGSVSCPDSFADGQKGLFTIYADDDTVSPLFTAEISRETAETSFELDLSGAAFLTFAIHSDDPTENINVMITDAVLDQNSTSSTP